jgi:hypothetical protein
MLKFIHWQLPRRIFSPSTTLPPPTPPASLWVVVSFVVEAEIAGVFAAARIALDERHILADLGHPQPPTIIYCDNE